MDAAESRLQAAIESAHKACLERWAREEADLETVFQIEIPAQRITVKSGSYARYVLQTLKGFGICGTYRVVTK